MSKKYSAADYARLAEQYAAKAKVLQEQEYQSIGEMFCRVLGKCSTEEAEQFLTAAIKNNQQYHWYHREGD